MFAQNFFYISVGVGFWLIVAVMVVLGIEAIKTIHLFNKAVRDVRSTMADLESFKNTIKLSVLGTVSNLLGKGGGKHNK